MKLSDRWLLFVNVKLKSSCCFKVLKHSPSKWINRKSREDGTLSKKWIKEIDKKLATEKMIILLVDNCQAQPTIDNLNLT